MACHIRRDDIVEVIAGDHKGERGKVLKVLPKRRLVVVQGINMVYRHVRPSRRNPQGGRLQKEAPIHMSNVLPVDDKGAKGTRGATRVRFEVERDAGGQAVAKFRVSRAGNRLSVVSRRKAEA